MTIKSFVVLLVTFTTISVNAQNLTKVAAEKLISEELNKQRDLQKAKAVSDWQQKQVNTGNYKLKFEYKIFGEKPIDGRSLYISLHGGGNTSVAANDQQWKNQIALYTPAEGVYLAPRAPTNTWNLWHEEHIDDLFADVIKAAILNEDVNPNKVYLLGYSAGGDGLYQLAPRMADYWAAASMMAGHPGDASATSLRNLPFGIYMGGADAAYKRNEHAATWKKLLDSLQKENPGDFVHDVHIFSGMPHWMGRKDTIAMAWMSSFKRNPLPNKVSWHQDDRHHHMFYWLGVPVGQTVTGAETVVSIKGNIITIEENDNPALDIYLNDKLIDLDKKVQVIVAGKTIFNKKINRKAELVKETAKRLDNDLIFTAKLQLKDGKVTGS